jgi:AcrR family transcriptional regulator
MVSPERRRKEGSGTPRIGKGERKRQILSHARRLFLTQGYSATTMDDVAAAAEVSDAVLRRYFPDPAALFAAMLVEVRSGILDRWEAEAAAQTDPLAKLHTLAEQLHTAARDVPEFRIFHRALLDTPEEAMAAPLRDFYLAVEALIAGVIAEGQQSGVFRRPLDPRVGAWELIRTALGYALTVPLNIPLHGEADHLAQAIDCMLHCLLKTDV